MARLAGQSGQFKVNTTGSSPAAVLAVTNFTINTTGAVPEVTGMDSECWQAFVAGLKGWTVSASAHWDTAEAKTLGATPVISVGETLDFEGVLHASHTNLTFSGTCIVTGMTSEVSVDGSVDFTVEAQGTAALTYPSTSTSTTSTTTTSTSTTAAP